MFVKNLGFRVGKVRANVGMVRANLGKGGKGKAAGWVGSREAVIIQVKQGKNKDKNMEIGLPACLDTCFVPFGTHQQTGQVDNKSKAKS